MGGLLLAAVAPAQAQQDLQAVTDRATAIVKNQPADAANQVKQLTKEFKKNPAALTAIGRAFLDGKDTITARRFADLALDRDAKFAKAWVLKGDIFVMEDNPGEAASAYNQAIYFDPKDPQAYYKFAMVQRGVNPTEATAVLEQLRKERPDYPVDQLIGHIYYNAQKFEDAVNAYNKVSNVLSMDDENITEYAISTWLLGQREKSIEICQTALGKNPRKAAWNRLMLYNYTDLKQPEQALTFADRLFNASDSAHFTGEDYTYYGTALKLAKKYDEAMKAFTQALDFNKDNAKQTAVVYKNLSDLALEQGNYDLAVDYLQKSNALKDPLTLDDLDNLGTLYTDIAAAKTEKKDVEGAAEAFRKADAVYGEIAEKFPASKNYCNYMRGQINANLDPDSKKGLAKPFYEALATELVAKEERNSSEKTMATQALTYLLVYHYNVAKDKPKAKEYAQQLLTVDPENEVAKQVVAMP